MVAFVTIIKISNDPSDQHGSAPVTEKWGFTAIAIIPGKFESFDLAKRFEIPSTFSSKVELEDTLKTAGESHREVDLYFFDRVTELHI